MNIPNDSGAGYLPKGPLIGGLIVVLGLTAVGLVLLGTSPYGAGVSPDSTSYLATAESLLSGKGYVNHDGQPYTGWPPLFPTLLAGVGLLGIKPVVAARLLNALAMGAIVYTAAGLFARGIKSKVLLFLATLLAVFSLPLLSISVMAWTEPVFVLLIVLFLRQMAAFLREPTGSALVKGAVLAALCSLQRYTGVTAILTGAVVVLLPRLQDPLAARLKRLIGFACLACAPLAAWAVRNYALTSMLTGSPRIPSRYSLGENITCAADTLTRWFSPATVPLAIRAIGMGVILLLATAACLFNRHRAKGTPRRKGPDAWAARIALSFSRVLPRICSNFEINTVVPGG